MRLAEGGRCPNEDAPNSVVMSDGIPGVPYGAEVLGHDASGTRRFRAGSQSAGLRAGWVSHFSRIAERPIDCRKIVGRRRLLQRTGPGSFVGGGSVPRPV